MRFSKPVRPSIASLVCIAALSFQQHHAWAQQEGATSATQATAAPTTTTTAAAPQTSGGKIWNESAKHWWERIEEFRDEVKSGKANTGGVVLLGDSLCERWPMERTLKGLRIINRGIGGDKIGGSKYWGLQDRIQDSIVDVKPAAIFLLIGINDIVYASTPLESMEANYDKLLTQIRQAAPDTPLIVQSLLPVRGKFAQHNERIRAFNKVVEREAQKHGAMFLNLYPHFVDDKGELIEAYSKDDLHLLDPGYDKWTGLIRPIMEGL